jgi:hypothetical protein
MPQPRSCTLTRCNAVHTAFPNSQLAQPFATRRWFNHSPALPRTRAAPCPQPARAGAAVTHSAAVVGPSRCRGAYGSSFAAVGCTILDQSRDACVFHVPPQRAAGTASPAAGLPTCHECFRERAACARKGIGARTNRGPPSSYKSPCSGQRTDSSRPPRACWRYAKERSGPRRHCPASPDSILPRTQT